MNPPPPAINRCTSAPLALVARHDVRPSAATHQSRMRRAIAALIPPLPTRLDSCAPIPSTAMALRRLTFVLASALAVAACGSDDDGNGLGIISLGDAAPGETVGLIANEIDGVRYAEWLDRLDGTVLRLDIDDPDAGVETIATVDVGTDGEQRGLLGQVVIEGRRYASWTQPETFELVVGELLDDGPPQIVWSAGEAGGGAIGGVLDELDGEIVLGLGRNTEWDADTDVGGAIVVIDPTASADREEVALSVGYTNPWAFTVTSGGGVWVADNAAGPDPDDESRDDVERVGRADLVGDRNEMDEVPWPGRAPAAMVELPDGRLGICGFLDNELRAYDVVDSPAGERTGLERAGTIMPCLTGAAVFGDGTIVTIAQTDAGEALLIQRP